MSSSELEAGWDGPREGSHAARVEWHQRQWHDKQPAAEQSKASVAKERCGCAATAAQPARSLGSSNCHTSPHELFPTPFHAFVNSPEAAKLNEKLHGEFLDAQAARDQKRRVRFHYEGTLIRIDGLPGWAEYEKENQSKRGAVSGYSAKSRSRMLALVASLKSSVLPLFVTLTYPREWNAEPRTWKRNLDTFGKWLLRAYPQAAIVWKLEPQKRGAPHFHLLVYGIEFLPWQLVAVRWAEIVSGSNFPPNFPTERGKLGAAHFHAWIHNNVEDFAVQNHLQAGVRVEPIRSRRGIMCYCSKNYMGKECVLPEGWEKVGRFWGVIGRKSLPRSKVEEVEISFIAFVKVRRTARKWFASKGMRRDGSGAMSLFTSAHWQWVRVLELAQNGTTSPRDWLASPP